MPILRYTRTTHNIRITAIPIFLKDKSSQDDNIYTWAYSIAIENIGIETVQLMRRSWQIIDENGFVQKVAGEGVVGEKPILAMGKDFIYTSSVQLKTPSGVMSGSYLFHNLAGGSQDTFEVSIPMFSLDSPFTKESIA